jgi:hypothetical protein
MNTLRATVAAAVLAAAACGPPRYVYAPATVTSAEIAGTAALSYSIPPGAPRGELRVATLGITELADARAIHVRIEVKNRSDEVWRVDGHDQLADIGVVRRPRLLSAIGEDLTSPPAIAIGPGETGELDVFFMLPPDIALDTPVSFDAIVLVRTGERFVTQRAHFERFLAAPAEPPIREENRTPSFPGREPSMEWPPQ